MTPRKPIIEKPYRVPLRIDNRTLPYKSLSTWAKVLRYDVPEYSGEIRSQLNPFAIALYGGSEFGVMKLIRNEWPKAQVLELKEL